MTSKQVRKTAGGSHLGARFLLVRAGEWMPKRPFPVLLASVALFAAAPVVYLIEGAKGFQSLYLVDGGDAGLWTEWRGLSGGGFKLLGLSALGAVLILMWLLTYFGSRATRDAQSPPR